MVKLSAAVLHDESSITKGGVRKCHSVYKKGGRAFQKLSHLGWVLQIFLLESEINLKKGGGEGGVGGGWEG